MAARRRGVSILQALAEIVDLKAEAVTSCVFVLSMGFSIFLLSRFVPIFQFGLLNLLILLGGIAGKLFFMGSLTVWVARWRELTGIVSAPSQVTTEPLPLDLASSLGDNQRR
jgi:predicted RND superfamily exporter protein